MLKQHSHLMDPYGVSLLVFEQVTLKLDHHETIHTFEMLKYDSVDYTSIPGVYWINFGGETFNLSRYDNMFLEWNFGNLPRNSNWYVNIGGVTRNIKTFRGGLAGLRFSN